MRSIITTIQLLRGALKDYEYSYDFGDGSASVMIKGQLSNEVPVKALMLKAKKNEENLDRVISLVSGEAQSPSIDRDGEKISSYDLFLSNIKAFAKANGMHEPEFIKIDYDELNALKCIAELVNLFGSGQEEHVDIDITSGVRTLYLAVTLSMETLIYENVFIDNIVYAYIDKSNPATPQNEIRHVKKIYHLIDLINAVHDFTEHGRAFRLNELFSESKDSRFRELTEAMVAFSDKLSICMTDGIQDDIGVILGKMDEINENPLSYDAPITETVFKALIPSMKSRFVELHPDRERLLLSLMRWCFDRDMLQQAVSFFREKSADMMVRFGAIVLPETLKEIFEEEKKLRMDEHMQIAEYAVAKLKRLRFDRMLTAEDMSLQVKYYKSVECDECGNTLGEGHIYKSCSLSCEIIGSTTLESLYVTRERAESVGFQFAPGEMAETLVQDFLVYHHYIQFIRNTINHAGSYDDKIYKDKDGNPVRSLKTHRGRGDLPDYKKEPEVIMSSKNIRETMKEAIGLLEDTWDVIGRKNYEERIRLMKETERKLEEEKRAEEVWVGEAEKVFQKGAPLGIDLASLEGRAEGTDLLFDIEKDGLQCTVRVLRGLQTRDNNGLGNVKVISYDKRNRIIIVR